MNTSTESIAFNSERLLDKCLSLDEEKYVTFEVSPQQFRDIERLCSGSGLDGDLKTAIAWIVSHSGDLHQEALRYEEQGDGYGLPMGHCDFYTDEETAAIYQTTSGTIFCVTEEAWTIALPIKRSQGHHHRVIALVLGGLTFEEMDFFDRIYRLEGEEYKAGLIQRKERYDPILIPLGYEPQESWEEYLQREALRQEHIRSERTASDAEDFEDYDGADDEFDYEEEV